MSDFETGKATVDLATALRLLDALDIVLEAESAADQPGDDAAVDLDDGPYRYLRR